jgi:membrane dipeptidase
LSDFGREAIVGMNRVGVLVDVAHSGWRTSRETAKASMRPVVASHATCAGLYKHIRGKPGDTLKAICDTGGLVC